MDLAHEALLRDDRNRKPYWPTLRGWVDTEREQLQLRQVVERLAESWGAGTGKGGLVTGRQLRAFRPLLKSCVALSDRAQRFLRESRRRDWLENGAAAAILAVAIGVLGAFGYWINKEEMRPAMAFYVLAGKAGWILKKPEMVEIRPGEGEFPQSFWMGSGDDDPDAQADEKPRHEVTLRAPFAIGRYEVTFEEYELFARLTGRDVPS